MRKPTRTFLTFSFILLFLLFFSLVHSVFRLQLFKHTISEELEQKLMVATLNMEEVYKNIQDEAIKASTRVLEGNQQRSRLVVEQVYGLIDTIEKREGPVDTPQEMENLKAVLSEYGSNTGQCFWILDSDSRVVMAPQDGKTDVDLDQGSALEEWSGKNTDGPILLKSKAWNSDNPGYGKHIKAHGWTLVSFQQWGILEKKVNGIESLRRVRTDSLISKIGISGSAGVVDASMRLKEYTYAQLKGRPVDEIHLESALPASKLLFNKTDGNHEYVLIDPVSSRGKFRHMYVSYDETSGCHFFITQDIRTFFNGIDQRSSQVLVYIGALTTVLLMVNVSILFWELFVRIKSGEEA